MSLSPLPSTATLSFPPRFGVPDGPELPGAGAGAEPVPGPDEELVLGPEPEHEASARPAAIPPAPNRTPRRVTARADQKGIPCPQSDVDSLQLTGVFTDIPDDQRECPAVSIEGYSDVGGAINAYSASNQPMWDISNTTTWIRGNHQLNFGLNVRSWQLQRDLATGFLGSPYNFDIGFTGNRVADFLLGYYSNVGLFQPAAFSLVYWADCRMR